MPRRHARTWAIQAAFIVMLGVAPAFAQQRITGGRALDRNLRAGSGGINAPAVRNVHGLYNDALVTGNVGGLHRFRGSISYGAPGEFSGVTSADSNYQFRIAALPPGGFGNAGRSGPVQAFSSQSLQGTRAYRIGGGPGFHTGLSSTDTVSGPVYRQGVSAAQITRPDPNTRTLSTSSLMVGGHDLGLSRDAQGQWRQYTASPLTGVRMQALPVSPGTALQRALRPEAKKAPQETGDDPATGSDTPASEQPDNQADQQADTSQRVASMRIAPTLLLSQRLSDLRQPAQREDRRIAALSFRSEQIERQVFGREGWRSVEPGEDVYFDLLRRIDRVAAMKPAAGARANNQLVHRPDGEEQPAPPDRVERIAEQFRRTQRAPAGESANAEARDLEALIGKLDYDLAPLQSLSGGGQSPHDRIMSRAEGHLAKGDYFKAVELYQRAGAHQSGHPLVAIGKINAELGAGLYLSSTRHLRALLGRHPELIAARYAQPILPDNDRLYAIEQDLDTLIERNPTTDLPLLRAYLAYQQGRTREVDTALDELLKRNRRDMLVPMLRRIWVPASALQRKTADDAARSDTEPTEPASPPKPATPAPKP